MARKGMGLGSVGMDDIRLMRRIEKNKEHVIGL